MEQGAARERATERPSPPFGDAARGPEEAARVPEQARAESARGEHTHGEHPHGEPAAPAATQASGAPSAPASGAASAAASGPAPVPARAAVPAARPAPAARVVRHSVRGQILDALRTALVGGELVPGEVYSAPALGERFGVSATPVREAMQRLAVEGAVEVVPNRGFRVTERTPRELAELAEVRALIEVPVMLRLARTVPAGRWAELRPLAEATSTAAARGDRAHYAEADRAFHRAVLSLAGNEQLLAVADDLHRRSQWPLISAPVVRHGVLVADAAEHTALLDALTAQDLAVVEALVREHFTGSNA
ncbi:GntR family transcriptional regulator [Streptomyces sp. NPDC057680]|uniref:GntR family transcriptional regulator n=1 Tax=Streptomyces sp. NPDC057680 TaxID=3346208 RepID=UPI0036B53F74